MTMQELYNQALMCYQQNDYEKALMLLQQCEVSAQTNALMNECKNALKQQYKYVINDAVSSEDNDTLNEYISKYKKLLGEDDYLRSILVTKRENEHVAAAKKMNRNYVIGIVVFVALIAAVVLGSRYGKQNQDDNNDTYVSDATSVDTLVTDYTPEETNSDDFRGGDLNMFFVHGHVKQIIETSSLGESKELYGFDRKGMLTTYPANPDMIRDSSGRIIKFIYNYSDESNEEDDVIIDCYTEFKYDSEGHLISKIDVDTSTGSEGYSDFDENGIPQSGVWGGEEEDNLSMQIQYTEFDRHGNWTEMKVCKLEPNPEFNHVYTVWRKITYYE